MKTTLTMINRIAELIIKYRNNTISLSEGQELNSWIDQRTENFLLFLELLDDEHLHNASSVMLKEEKNANWKKIEEKILQTTPVNPC